jgi:aminoglycoside phosphotransferase (APT) family kinase protein
VTGLIPDRFRDEVIQKIGHGGEATVYELTGDRVLRVFHKTPDSTIVRHIMPFYEQLARYTLPFAVPKILEFGDDDGLAYSLDRRIPGRAFHDVLPGLSGTDRERALDSYTDAAGALAVIELKDQPYGEFQFDDALQSTTWAGFLLARLDANYERGRSDLVEAIPDVDDIVDSLRARIGSLPDPPKVLVHGDYFPGNVLMDDDLNVTGLIDFGWLTVAGDPAMDLASAAIFLDVVRGHHASDPERVHARLLATFGESLAELIEIFRGWYAVRFSPYKADDQSLFAWCVKSLQRFRDAA